MNEYYIKISKCINSSTTKEQLNSCEKLIEFFEFKFCKKYKDSKYAKNLLKNLINQLCIVKDIYN